VALAERSLGRLTDSSERLDLKVVDRGAGGDPISELDCLGAELLVGEGLKRRLGIVDCGDDALELSECLAFSGAKDLGEDWH
jgi:hypothetical protein